MWSSSFYGNWNFWSIYDPSNKLFGDQKVAFDGPNKIIYIIEGVRTLSVKDDIYSAWKEWILGSYEYPNPAAYQPAISVVGGDPITDTQSLGTTYFLENGWRIQPYASQRPYILEVLGNIYTREAGQNPFLFAEGASISLARSNLVDQVNGGGADAQAVWEYPTRELTQAIPTAAQIAAQVWNTNYNTVDADGTTGHLLNYIKNLHKRIYIDTTALTNGNGSQELPYNNITDAIDRAEIDGIRELELKGELILDRDIKNFDVHGIGLPKVECNGFNIQGCHFSEVRLKGAYTTGTNPNTRGNVIVRDCLIEDVTTLEGFFENCALQGNMQMNADSYALLKDCTSAIPGTNRPTISMNAGNQASLNVRGWNGGLTIKDCDTVNDVVTVELAAGSLTFDSSCTAGTMVARGVGNFVDETTGATVVDETLNRTALASNVAIDYGLVSDAVWDHLLTDMNTAGSAGERLKALLTLNKYLGLS